MLYLLIAIALVAHTYFWGAGLAGLMVPRAWKRWWWVFAPGFGWALQSAVVWAGAHSPLAGTQTYAWWSELIPAALLGWALKNSRDRQVWWQSLRLRFWAGAGLIMLVAGAVLIWPLAQAGRGLTASSLGSCDQADYAAGARVFQEFASTDRVGFLGLTEVTKVRSADHFFEVCLRMNHFTPSALLAHNGAIFGVEFYRLVSVTAAVLVLLNLPLVLWLARVLVGIRGGWLLGVGAIYGLAPVNAYAVHHGALGQLYAAQGIAWVTLAAWGAQRALRKGQVWWPYGVMALAAFWLLVGSYNFILTVALAPAGAWWLARVVLAREIRATVKAALVVLGALLVCALLFWGRFNGLIERFSLFKQYDFGWAVPLLTPEGWCGLVRGADLHPWAPAPRAVVATLVMGLWLAGLGLLWRRRKADGLALLALVLPVMAGWAILAWESRVRTNASYDAYKIISVFYPGLLAGLLGWLVAVRGAARGWRAATALALVLVVVANAIVAGRFARTMRMPPLRLDRSIVELGELENNPRYASFNLRIEDFWSRLWANAFLLRKPQYFPVHTYEGRLNTPLVGEWDLADSLLRAAPFAEEDFVQVNSRFHLTRVAAPGRLLLEYGGGWYAEEKAGAFRWRWSDGGGRITVWNPAARSVRANLRLQVRSVEAGKLILQAGETVLAEKTLDGSIEDVVFPRLVFPSGRTELTLVYPPARAPQPGDARTLALALYRFRLHATAWAE